VVGRDHVVQHGKTEALLRLKYPNAGNGADREPIFRQEILGEDRTACTVSKRDRVSSGLLPVASRLVPIQV
jgi:hypothetical protein